jgi:hypothetical protein
VDVVPAAEVEQVTERGLTLARENAGPARAARVAAGPDGAHRARGGGAAVKVPMRCLFALSGMGFVSGEDGDAVRVSATGSWLRLDARFGAVVRRRLTALPLLV